MEGVKALLVGLMLLWASQSFSQLKVGDKPTIINKAVSMDAQGSLDVSGYGKQGFWLPRVYDTSITGIRALNPPDGLIIYHPPSGRMFLRSNNAWVTYYTGGIASMIAGQTVTGPNVTLSTANAGTDFTIAANTAANTITYNLPDASTLNRGVVTTGIQTFGGAKTFANGATVNNGLNVTSATTYTSNLTLGVNSTTTPGPQADRYLSVNSSGKVVLDSVNVSAPDPVKIKTFSNIQLDNPTNISAGTSTLFTFTLAGASLSTNSTVLITPAQSLTTGTSIGWSKVVNATTIQVSISAQTTQQKFNNGVGVGSAFFNITVFEF